MKLRFRIAPPRREDGTILPASLVALLGAMAVTQLALTGQPELPERTIAPVPPSPRLADPPPVVADPALLRRPIFSPTRRGGMTPVTLGDAAATGPLGGAVVVGAMSGRRFRVAFLRLADGTVRRLPIGGSHEGWRLTGLDSEGARFTRGGERLTMPYGRQPDPPPAQSDDDETEDE